MPWTVEDVKKHKKGLTPKQEQQWVAVANSILQKCKDNGGTDETCAPSAIRQANGVVDNNVQVNFTTTAKNYEVKVRMHQGRKHLIVPVTMMVEGVHSGTHGALLHTINELGQFPDSWNKMPIIVNHPQDEEGNYVSANDPDIADSPKTVGHVYHTRVDGSRLKAEAWLDEEKLNEASPETLANVNAGKPIEVSVGVFTSDEPVENGEWNGEEYIAIARNHRPDHLALLPDATGACSIEDGCGIRNNQKGGNNIMDVNAKVTDMESKRKELGMSVAEFYAIPRDPPSESKLPIFDAAHVRNALARFDQVQGISADEKASAKRKIDAAAKKFKIDVSGNQLVKTIKELNIAGYSISEIGMNIDPVEGAETNADVQQEGLIRQLDNIRQAVNSMDTNDSVHSLEEAYDDSIIFSKRSKDQTGYYGEAQLYKQPYELDTKGSVSLTGKAEPVKKQVSYVSNNVVVNVSNNSKKEVKIMSKEKCTPCIEKKVNALIANTASGFIEGDREWLQGLEEVQLDKIVTNSTLQVNTSKEVTSEQIITAMKGMKPEDRVKLLPDEDQHAISSFKKIEKEKRDNLIKGIQDNTSKELWPDAVLSAMPDDNLERIFNSVKKEEVVDYSPLGGGRTILDNAADELLLPAGVELETKK